MGKQFKLRLSKIFQSCRSKDPSNLPTNPVPSFPQPANNPHRSSLKRHVSSALGCGLSSNPEEDRTESPPPQDQYYFKWQKEEKWHVVTPRHKIYNSSASACSEEDDLFPVSRPHGKDYKKKPRGRRRRVKTTSSSEDSDSESLIGCSSSRSFSMTESSSEVNYVIQHLETISEVAVPRRAYRKKKKKKKRVRRVKRGGLRSSGGGEVMEMEEEGESPARLSVFKKLIPCAVEGKVKESFAVVKKSEDPYEDFKRSMIEMILEKQMFDEKELEQLLQCFLSLNSRHYHPLIVEAFTEIWEAIFTRNSVESH